MKCYKFILNLTYCWGQADEYRRVQYQQPFPLARADGPGRSSQAGACIVVARQESYKIIDPVHTLQHRTATVLNRNDPVRKN